MDENDIQSRVNPPLIWGRVLCGIRFEDLQQKRFDNAVRLLKRYYLTDEVTYRSVMISDDREGADEFAYHVRVWMKDNVSIAAVREGTNKLVGVLVMRIHESESYFRNKQITYNVPLKNVMNFYKNVEKPINLFHKLNISRYLNIYILALKPKYRHRGLAREMIKAAISLASYASIPAIAGIFTTARGQIVAEELGFVKLNEILYEKYLINEQFIFRDTGIGNHGAAFMAFRIPEDEGIKVIHSE